MAELDIGDALPLYFAFRGPDGQLLDTDVELSITKPDGDTITPTPDHLDTGRWSYDLLIEQAGRYSWVWTATGAGSGVERGSFMVGASPVVATPGALDANSYITVAEADAIAAEIGLGPADEGWLDASEASKARALIRATTEIDAYVRTAGSPWFFGQRLLFPRLLDVNDLGVALIIPDIRYATYAQAAHVLRNARALDDADTRRAQGLISFSSDDGSGSVVAARPEFGQLSSRALQYLRAVRSTGRSRIRSVPITSSYGR